jgi:hypothetical protein
MHNFFAITLFHICYGSEDYNVTDEDTDRNSDGRTSWIIEDLSVLKIDVYVQINS